MPPTSAGATGLRLGGLPLRVASGPPGVALGRRPTSECRGLGPGRRLASTIPSVLDHVSIQCADLAASSAFYDAVLSPLGGRRVIEIGAVMGYGVADQPTFWLGPLVGGAPNREIHVAFRATDRSVVRAFWDAGTAIGAEILHEPHLWPEYHPNYFGAFLRDPDGNNVEAVCHRPE